MNIFIAIAANAEKLEKDVQKSFPDFNHEILSGVWAVAADKGLPDVLDALGITPEGKNPGVVFTLHSYHGYYDPTLWEKFNNWVKT